jgi:hypothetical protein
MEATDPLTVAKLLTRLIGIAGSGPRPGNWGPGSIGYKQFGDSGWMAQYSRDPAALRTTTAAVQSNEPRANLVGMFDTFSSEVRLFS